MIWANTAPWWEHIMVRIFGTKKAHRLGFTLYHYRHKAYVL